MFFPSSAKGTVMVRNSRDQHHFCSATLIKPTFVLTAASCVMRRGYAGYIVIFLDFCLLNISSYFYILVFWIYRHIFILFLNFLFAGYIVIYLYFCLLDTLLYIIYIFLFLFAGYIVVFLFAGYIVTFLYF